MKSPKILLALIFGIFLISFVSAVISVDGDWQNGTQSLTITKGENALFNIELYSYGSEVTSMTLNVKLYDSNDVLVHAFEDGASYSNNWFYQTYTITPDIYAKAGSYQIIILGSDNTGSTDSYSLTLTVNPAPDTTPPVITLLGDNPVSIEVGTPYIDAGATATDNIDGDITDKITTANNVNVNILGTYTVVYSVQDDAGNSATQVTRTVNVIEGAESNTAPEITSTATTEVNEGYDYNYQIIATDAEDDTLTYSLIENPTWLSINSDGLVTGTAPEVSYNTDYQVTISVSDGEDYVTQAYTLTVKDTTQPPEPDTTSPEITIISPEDGKTYTSPIDELHFTVTDEHLNSCLVNDNPVS